jgi:hypothetical protein
MELPLASTNRRSRKRTQQEPERDLRVVEVGGVEYFVNWDALTPGASFFIPTVCTASQVKAALAPAEQAYDFKFAVHTRVEYERYGARVWRIY